MFPTQNLHVKETVRLLTPRALKAEFPMSEASNRTVVESRQNVMEILEQKDSRLLVVVGPCSIHDVDGALEYGARLNALRKELAAEVPYFAPLGGGDLGEFGIQLEKTT